MTIPQTFQANGTAGFNDSALALSGGPGALAPAALKLLEKVREVDEIALKQTLYELYPQTRPEVAFFHEKCSQCGYRFKSKWELSQHLDAHFQERNDGFATWQQAAKQVRATKMRGWQGPAKDWIVGGSKMQDEKDPFLNEPVPMDVSFPKILMDDTTEPKCQVCGEHIQAQYDTEADTYYWINATRRADKLLQHFECGG